MRLSSYYSADITRYSRKELGKFMKYVEKNGIEKPYLVGGWAVYVYGSTYGSLDVDLVFKKKEDAERIKEFYKVSGYVLDKSEKDFYKKSFFVQLQKNRKRLVEIWFDCFSFDERNYLLENEQIEIPWHLLEKYSKNAKIKNLRVKVPVLELLLLYKVKALRDHEWKLKQSMLTGIGGTRQRERTKAAKDIQDIKDIIETGKVDGIVVDELLAKTRFGKYFEDSMKKLGLEV